MDFAYSMSQKIVYILFESTIVTKFYFNHAIMSVLSMAWRYSFNPNPRLLAVWRWVLHFLKREMYCESFL